MLKEIKRLKEPTSRYPTSDYFVFSGHLAYE
jgi:hypothetical protein